MIHNLNPLKTTSSVETQYLQPTFDSWHKRAHSRQLFVGIPQWLSRISSPDHRPAFFPTSSRPDVLWADGADFLVGELKWETKGDPIALAQVLYYARTVLSAGASLARIFTVTQTSLWLRDAVELVRRSGFSIPLNVLELSIWLNDGNSGLLLWFDDPLATWTAIGSQAAPPEVQRMVPTHCPQLSAWYHNSDAHVWIQAPVPKPTASSPLPYDQDYCAYGRVFDGNLSDRGWARWVGNPTSWGALSYFP